MKSREFVRDYLVPAGAVLHKKDGDHYVYVLPNGRKFVMPMGGCHSEAKPYLFAKRRRLLVAGSNTSSGVVDVSGINGTCVMNHDYECDCGKTQ
jgi:hypothetical protein